MTDTAAEHVILASVAGPRDERQARGVAVGVAAEHTCLGLRGGTPSRAFFGQLADGLRRSAEVLSLAEGER
jgi:hypothetical protein